MTDKVAIVTGAGSKRGIGRSAAIALAKRGCTVAVCDINHEIAIYVASEICDMGGNAFALQADVANLESVDAMVNEVYDRCGRIDILVNNAGISQPLQFAEITEQDWDRTIDIDLKSVFLCSQAVFKKCMQKQRYGKIISVSSQAGKTGGGHYGGAHYSAAKAGIIGLTRAMAKSLAPYGITVNCICPGTIETDIRVGISEEREDELTYSSPMRRQGTPDEVAECIVFLSSDASSYVTGEDLNCNGASYVG